MCLGLIHKLAQSVGIFLVWCLHLVQVYVNVLIVPSSVLLNSICLKKNFSNYSLGSHGYSTRIIKSFLKKITVRMFPEM